LSGAVTNFVLAAKACPELRISQIREQAGFNARQRAKALGIDFFETWSCYKGGEIHCATCGTCVERREAFILAGLPDPTRYERTPALPVLESSKIN